MPSICQELTSAFVVLSTILLPLQDPERPAAGPTAQQGQTPGQAQGQAQGQTQGQTQQGQTQQKPEDVKYKETVVVSASKKEQQLVNAPATMTVIGPEVLNLAPSTNYGDILRAVPGVNVTQMSA